MSERLSGPVSSAAGDAGRKVEPSDGGSDQAATGAEVTVPDSAPVAAEKLATGGIVVGAGSLAIIDSDTGCTLVLPPKWSAPLSSPAGRPVDASSGVKTSVVAVQPGSLDDELDLLYSPVIPGPLFIELLDSPAATPGETAAAEVFSVPSVVAVGVDEGPAGPVQDTPGTGSAGPEERQ